MAKTRKQRVRPPQPTHLDAHGRARMVDVGQKPATVREAVAEALLQMKPSTLRLIKSRRVSKGDALAVARIAGIQAAKRTHELIPLCHSIPLSHVGIEYTFGTSGRLSIRSTVRCTASTGAEMEALCAAGIAALTVYDMLKAVDRGMSIGRLRLLEKSGGRSGHWIRGRT